MPNIAINCLHVKIILFICICENIFYFCNIVDKLQFLCYELNLAELANLC